MTNAHFLVQREQLLMRAEGVSVPDLIGDDRRMLQKMADDRILKDRREVECRVSGVSPWHVPFRRPVVIFFELFEELLPLVLARRSISSSVLGGGRTFRCVAMCLAPLHRLSRKAD